MIKVIFIAFFLISVCYGQIDSTRTNYSTDGGGVGYKVTASQLNGRSIDSLRFFKLTGGTDTNRRVMNVIYSQYGGVFGNGSDMTSRINAMYNKPYVSSVTFAYDTVTIITVSGTVNITNNTEIKGAVSFTGSGTINFNGNILDADPNKTIFGPNLTVTGLKTVTGDIPSAWFGAVGNGSTDNKGFLDKAQGAASAYKQTVVVGSGTYQINSAFTQTVPFRGEVEAAVKFNPSSLLTGVTMWTINADSVTLKNITIDGSNKCYQVVKAGLYTDITIDGVTVMNFSHSGSETPNVSGIFFGQGCDRLRIINCLIKNGTAPNSGVCRGIRGAYAGIGPKGVEIAWNRFENIRPGNASDDADDICIQDFTDSLGMQIHHNIQRDMWKRAVKLQCSGLEYYNNDIKSNRYATNGTRSWAAMSIYGNAVYAHNNTVWGGVFEQGCDVGAGTTLPWKNIRVENNRFLFTAAGTYGDGIREHGAGNSDIIISGNYMEYVRIGIFLGGGGRGYTVDGNIVKYATDNSYSTNSDNSYPNNWHYNVSMLFNKAIKGSAAAWALGNINGGVFSHNTIDSTNTFILNYAPYVDSLLWVTAEGNTVSPAAYGTGARVNMGNYSQRLTLSNPNSLPGLQYVALDSNQSTFLYQGGAYVKIGAAAAGGGITALTGDVTASGPGSAAATIANSAVTNTKVATGIDAAKLADGSVSNTELQYINSLTSNAQTQLNGKQATLVSGTNIKTIDGQTILGSGDIPVGVTSVSAGNGMNFTTITGTGSVALGTPSTLTISTTNSSSGTTHTHALDLSGRTLTAGNGLTGGGTLGADRTFTLGTPSNVTLSSTNSVTGTTHTHAFAPGGTAAQLIRGNGTLSTALSSTGYVKFNSGTNDYSTSSTVPYSDISGSKPTSGEYVADTLYTNPVLTSFAADTLIYTVIEDKVHVAGSFQATTDGAGGYVIDIEFPPGLESYYTGFPGFIYGSGTALTALGSNPLPVTIFGGGLNNPGGVRLTFTGGASTTYNVIFSFDYKIIPND